MPKKKAPAVPEKPAETPSKAAKPEKPAPAPKISKPIQKNFLAGLIFVVTAFLGVVIIVYMMMQATAQKEERIGELNDLLTQLNNEKNIIQAELNQLKAQGDSIKLDKLVEAARSFYDQGELSRKEGLLWFNRRNNTYLITLGAVHGLAAGSTVAVFDNDNQIGTLQVETPYDVISFCTPVRFTDVAGKNYYRVAIE